MSPHFDQINWLAVPLAAIAGFCIGGIIYGAIFGKAWVRLHGYDKDIEKERASHSPTFVLVFLGYVVMAFVLALALTAFEGVTWKTGALVALVAWGVAALPDQIIQNAAHRKPVAAFAMDTVHSLLALVASGAILGAWR